MNGPLVVEHRTTASPEAVYRCLVASTEWARWQGAEAEIDASPGGIFRMTMAAGQTARGQFVEFAENRRVVFTWGWVDAPGIPPGSTLVEIDLVPEAGGTLIRLTHRDLGAGEVSLHRMGWEHYLPRLAAVAAGEPVGPDPGPG